jgi:hypothetical protein
VLGLCAAIATRNAPQEREKGTKHRQGSAKKSHRFL